jgi:thymidylate synthase
VSEQPYLDLLRDCLDNGVHREGRNGGTYGLFGRQIRFDLSRGFPLLTTKRVWWKGVVTELLWMLRGETNTAYLKQHGVAIWDEWQDDAGDLGPVYGYQWRKWDRPYPTGQHIDQIAGVIKSLREDPYGRRHIVTAWNPADLNFMALPPCHCLFQFFVADGKLSCQLYQRSADIFLGVPFNIASYALLTHLIAREVGLEVGEFVHTFGDVHLYANHVEQAREQLSREPRELPQLIFDGWTPEFESMDELVANTDMGPLLLTNVLFGYDPHGTIRAEVSA